jgi:hypothetical protein
VNRAFSGWTVQRNNFYAAALEQSTQNMRQGIETGPRDRKVAILDDDASVVYGVVPLAEDGRSPHHGGADRAVFLGSRIQR